MYGPWLCALAGSIGHMIMYLEAHICTRQQLTPSALDSASLRVRSPYDFLTEPLNHSDADGRDINWLDQGTVHSRCAGEWEELIEFTNPIIG